MVEIQTPAVLRSISIATESVAVGELLQVQETHNFGLTEENYLKIIGNKTASLFAAACETGALLGNDARHSDRFRNFGELVGLGFQIADDLLDYIGDVNLTGKPLGNDLREGKITLPLIFALRDGPVKVREDLLQFLNADGRENGFHSIVDYVRGCGGFDYAQEKASDYCTRALDMLDGVRDSIYKDALQALVAHAVSRQS
jgi:octaprenyl-diphosphate synthase